MATGQFVLIREAFMRATTLPVLRVARAAALVGAVLAGAVLLAQADAQQPAPVFRGGVDAVTVDAIVLDRDGRPVRDLTAADFEIREAGKLQTIVNFRLVETDDGLDDPRAAREILSFDEHAREAARLDNRLFVFFLDDYHVRRENSMRVRQELASFLRELSPHDLVAIATPWASVAGLTFTRNHTAAASNVMAFEGRKYDYTPRNAVEERYQNLPIEQQEQMRNSITISALANVSEYLGTMRDGRKTIVYVSEGMSGSLPAGVRVRTPFGPTQTMGPMGNGRDSFAFFETASLMTEIQTKLFASASRNNVSIYTLDPRGLAAFEYGVNEDVSDANDRRIVQETVDSLRVIADETDGRAIVARNDLAPALRQMVSDSRTYYLLGYTSTEAPRDGKFHRIDVRVKRPGVDVRARKGYWAYSPEMIAKATAPPRPRSSAEVTDALDALANSSAVGRGRLVSVWMGAVRGASPELARVTLAWEGAPVTAATSALDAVDRVGVVATTLSGRELFSGSVPKGDGLGRPMGVVTFDAPPGPLRVRVTAENARGLRLDNTEEALDVPDFTGAGPFLTKPFLYRGRTARDLQQVRSAAAPAPAVLPVFSRTERVLIRFGAYGPAGTRPTVTMRLLNQQGGSIASLPPPSANPAGDLESELGLGAFPPGDYLVEIEAEASGESVKRLVGLRVTG